MCTVFLGITNPFAYELREYLGYDISKLRDSFRVLEVVLSRKGKANGLCPLYFDGAVNDYRELPRPDDSASINKWYQWTREKRERKTAKSFFMYVKQLFKRR